MFPHAGERRVQAARREYQLGTYAHSRVRVTWKNVEWMCASILSPLRADVEALSNAGCRVTPNVNFVCRLWLWSSKKLAGTTGL